MVSKKPYPNGKESEMAEPKALFAAHFNQFKRYAATMENDDEAIHDAAIIYGACIIASAILNAGDVEIKTPEGGIK